MSISRRKFTASLLALGALSQMKTSALAKAIGDSGLKAAFRDDFYIGTAVSTSTLAENDTDMLALIAREFNAITAENAMKWEVVCLELDSWQWELADKFMEFGVRNNMYVVGHTLAWHSQVPPAVFLDKKGKTLVREDRKSTRLNSSHVRISYAVFCLKKKKNDRRVGSHSKAHT